MCLVRSQTHRPVKPTKIDLNDYQKLVETYHSESDRAAALLAGSFVEHYLAEYLKTCYLVKDPDIDDLFHGFGPMATFSQRISIAHAVGAIDKGTMDELRALKEIRNHFAHHPRDAKFSDSVLDKYFNKLGPAKNPAFDASGNGPLTDRRLIYLFTVSWFVMQVHNAMLAKGKPVPEINNET